MRGVGRFQYSNQRVVFAGLDEELELHLLELARAEQEVARRDLVAEALADLRDAEGGRMRARVHDVDEVDEDALRGLRAQVDDRGRLLDRPHVGLEHQVEAARLGQLAAALAGMLARLLRAAELVEVVGAEAPLALLAVDHRVGEVRDVPRGLPDCAGAS